MVEELADTLDSLQRLFQSASPTRLTDCEPSSLDRSFRKCYVQSFKRSSNKSPESVLNALVPKFKPGKMVRKFKESRDKCRRGSSISIPAFRI